MDAHILLSPVGQKTETRFNCFLTENRKSTEMVGTPSTVRKLLPPPTGRSPSLKEGGLGAARALSKILIQLRVQGRNPGRFNGGYGVPRGFKGEKSKSPPNPLGLAERGIAAHFAYFIFNSARSVNVPAFFGREHPPRTQEI